VEVEMPARVLVIGLDSMDHRLIERWCAEGRLPNIARVRERAVEFALDNALDALPGSIWVELSTGRSVGHDGRYYVPQQLRTGEAIPRVVEPRDVDTSKDFWTIAGAHGKRVVAFDIPERVPHRGLNGIHLGEWNGHDSSWSTMSEPPELAAKVAARFPAHPVPYCDAVHGGGAAEYSRLVRALVEGVALRGDVASWLIDRDNWDLAVVGMIEVHCVGHQFWSFNDPRHPLQVADVPDDIRHAIRTVYEATDAQVGRLLEHAGAGATVFLLASHGYQPFVHGPQLLPELLMRLGLRRAPSRLAVAPSYLPSFARAALRPVMPTSLRNRRNARAGLVPMSFDLASPSNRVAALENNRCGALRINLRGREPYGRVESGAQAEAIVANLRAELEALTDPVSGERIVTRVATARELFGPDHHPDLPDVMVEFRDDLGPLEMCVGPRVGTITVPCFPRDRRTDGWPQNLRRTGDHAAPSKLWLAGAGVHPRGSGGSGRAIDVAPTVLSVLDVPIPPSIDGAPLTSRVGDTARSTVASSDSR
jgi:predicted AlkP superfamily phosphohydrolase/phosphomutase